MPRQGTDLLVALGRSPRLELHVLAPGAGFEGAVAHTDLEHQAHVKVTALKTRGGQRLARARFKTRQNKSKLFQLICFV